MRRSGTFNVTIVPQIREGYRTVEYGDFFRRFLKILKTYTFTTRKPKPRLLEFRLLIFCLLET